MHSLTRHSRNKPPTCSSDPPGPARPIDLDQEPDSIRQRYGEHVCGQSLLLLGRLVEAGVPLVRVICSKPATSTAAAAITGRAWRQLSASEKHHAAAAGSGIVRPARRPGRIAVCWIRR